MAQRYPSLENATNAFLIAYEQRLPTQLRVRTKVEYRNYVRQMIRHENARNPLPSHLEDDPSPRAHAVVILQRQAKREPP